MEILNTQKKTRQNVENKQTFGSTGKNEINVEFVALWNLQCPSKSKIRAQSFSFFLTLVSLSRFSHGSCVPCAIQKSDCTSDPRIGGIFN